MNKYMLVLLLAAPGAVYAMEQGDTPAGVGSPGPNTNSQPGGSILAQVTQGSLNRGDDVSAEFGNFEKDMEEVKGDVSTLQGDVGKLQAALAALKSNQNGTAVNDLAWDKVKKSAVVAKLIRDITKMQVFDAEGAGAGEVSFETRKDREQLLNAFLKNVTTYGKNIWKK